MIDIHSHILHELDDGSQSIEESVELIKCMINQKVTKVIATPHMNKGPLNVDKSDTIRSYNELMEEIKRQNLDIDIMLGNEINIRGNIYNILKSDGFYTLNHTKYILLELNDDTISDELCDTIYEIGIMGYIPVIAHVERYMSLYNDKELLRSILDEKVHLQLNASSILERKSSRIYEFSDYLLKNKLISFIASDAHNMHTRAPHMAEAYNLIKINYGENYADEIFTHNPEKLISNQPIEFKILAPEPKKKKLFNIFGKK